MDAATGRWGDVAAAHPALRLLVLLGSRASGTPRADSDWDLGFLADAELDLGTLAANLTHALGTDAVDVVDLARASAVLRRDAVSGVLLYERSAGEFVEFQVEAALFWCDVEPVLREAHADVLRAAAG